LKQDFERQLEREVNKLNEFRLKRASELANVPDGHRFAVEQQVAWYEDMEKMWKERVDEAQRKVEHATGQLTRKEKAIREGRGAREMSGAQQLEAGQTCTSSIQAQKLAVDIDKAMEEPAQETERMLRKLQMLTELKVKHEKDWKEEWLRLRKYQQQRHALDQVLMTDEKAAMSVLENPSWAVKEEQELKVRAHAAKAQKDATEKQIAELQTVLHERLRRRQREIQRVDEERGGGAIGVMPTDGKIYFDANEDEDPEQCQGWRSHSVSCSQRELEVTREWWRKDRELKERDCEEKEKIPMAVSKDVVEPTWDSLCNAAADGDVEKIRELLGVGASPNATFEVRKLQNGKIHRVAVSHEYAAKGVHLNMTVLGLACWGNHLEAAKLLMKHKALVGLVNEPLPRGVLLQCWPLPLACDTGAVSCVKLLLEAKAVPTTHDIARCMQCTTLLETKDLGETAEDQAVSCLQMLLDAAEDSAALVEGETEWLEDTQGTKTRMSPLQRAQTCSGKQRFTSLLEAPSRRRADQAMLELLQEEDHEKQAAAAKSKSKTKKGKSKLSCGGPPSSSAPLTSTKQPASVGAAGKAAGSARAPALSEAVPAASDANRTDKGVAVAKEATGDDGAQEGNAEVEAAAEAAAKKVKADSALEGAMQGGELEALSAALDAHRDAASEAVVVEARKLRDRLKERRKRETQKQRRAHAAAMKQLQDTEDLLAVVAGVEAAAAEAASAPTAPTVASANKQSSGLPVVRDDLALADMRAATGNFSTARMVGQGGFASVFSADFSGVAGCTGFPGAVAVKKGPAVREGSEELAELKREVELLQRCTHEHLLPLVGVCWSLEAPCLLFPLMRGGSFEMRLRLDAEAETRLQRLGHATKPKPLTWRQRLRVILQASRALAYLHSSAALHRDFKPANILLDERLHAYLSDTGFAKGTSPAGLASITTTSGTCYTPGYADEIITNGGQYSKTTDGYAVGITLTVALTNRSAMGIFASCEEEYDLDFADIPPESLAPGWPPVVVGTIVSLVRRDGNAPTLCHQSKRKRLELSRVVETLSRILDEWAPGQRPSELPNRSSGRPSRGLDGVMELVAESAADLADAETASPTITEDAAGECRPSDASLMVRRLGQAAAGNDKRHRLQRNASSGFDALMRSLDSAYANAKPEAPNDFRERLDYWRDRCALPPQLHALMHRLRVWRNASEHHDEERWVRDGPKDEVEFMTALRKAHELVLSVDEHGERIASASSQTSWT